MSSSSSHSNATFSNSQNLLDAALSAYREKTGKDVATDPLTVRLLRCDSSDAVLGILQEKAHVFDQCGNGDWNVQIVSLRRLKSIVDILFGLSTSGVFREGIGLVRINVVSFADVLYLFRRGCQQRKQYLPVSVSYSQCVSSFVLVTGVLIPKFIRPLRELALVMMHSSTCWNVSNTSSAILKPLL